MEQLNRVKYDINKDPEIVAALKYRYGFPKRFYPLIHYQTTKF